MLTAHKKLYVKASLSFKRVHHPQTIAVSEYSPIEDEEYAKSSEIRLKPSITAFVFKPPFHSILPFLPLDDFGAVEYVAFIWAGICAAFVANHVMAA